MCDDRLSLEAISALTTYLHVADIEVLCRVSACQVPPHIHIIVPHNPSNEVRGRDAGGSLYGHKLAHVLNRLVDVLSVTTVVWQVVMGNKVNLGNK